MSIGLTIDGVDGYFQNLGVELSVSPELLGSEVEEILFFPGDDEEPPSPLPVSQLLPILKSALPELECGEEDLFEYGKGGFLADLEELISQLEPKPPGTPIVFVVS